ncbi:hypothetical protein [Prosthecobacter algae]
MMRALFSAVLVMVGLTGCDSVRDISRDPRYATLVGREVRTKVPMWLYDFNEPPAPLDASELIEKDSGNHRKVGLVSVGQSVRFNKASRHRSWTTVTEVLEGQMNYKSREYWIRYRTYAHLGPSAWSSLFDIFDAERPPEKTYR